MDWELFDGHMFEEVRRTVGEWLLRFGTHQIQIQITTDRNGRYYYQNNHRSKNPGSQSRRALKKNFDTVEAALSQAVKDIEAAYGSRRPQSAR